MKEYTVKWTREISKQVTKLYLTNEKMTEGLKQEILKIAPDYPQKYFQHWFKNTHNYAKGIGGTEAGPGTNFMLGFLDAAKELDLDINLCTQAAESWRKNGKRKKAIKNWVDENTNQKHKEI